jgi:hypothetical protein
MKNPSEQAKGLHDALFGHSLLPQWEKRLRNRGKIRIMSFMGGANRTVFARSLANLFKA